MNLPSLNTDIKSEIQRIEGIFSEDNVVRWTETHTLLPVQTMLDVYGEAIRERAYVVADPIDGDFVLRPDFTVPIVETHMSSNAKQARYAYSGRVWRKRRTSHTQHSFWQMGIEDFGSDDQPQTDAHIFAIASRVSHQNMKARTGDLGLIFSILSALDIPEWRRQALLRHVWRPKSFDRLLQRFALNEPKHAKFLSEFKGFDADTKFKGKRDRQMIEDRIERLRQDAQVPAINPQVQSVIKTALEVKGNLRTASEEFTKIAEEFRPLKKFAENFKQRNQSLEHINVNIDKIEFDAVFGRETMEYYDGFVFSFGDDAITGGRYNGLTSVFGQGGFTPAVGFACRPEKLMER